MSARDDVDLELDPVVPKSGRGWGQALVRWGVILGIILVGIALFSPAIRTSRGAARRAQCVYNLKQIAVALNNYEQEYGALPPAYTVDAEGRPLHSWRTLILPYCWPELQSLYQSIVLTKPWDDPVNAQALKTATRFYQCPAATIKSNETTYLAIVAPGGCFLPDQPRRLAEISDGTANTLMVIEVDDDHAVPWMAPVDADDALVLSFGPKTKSHHVGGVNASFVDGTVRFLKNTILAPVRRALISIAGHEEIRADEY